MGRLKIKTLNDFYDIEKFLKELIACSEQAQANGVMVFAFILYRDVDYHLAEILVNENRWNALNEKSGDKLCVYSLKDSSTSSGPTQYSDQVFPKSSFSSLFTAQMMITIPYKRSARRIPPFKITDAIFTEDILNEKLIYPSILFFQIENKQIYDSVLYPLIEEGVEELHKEMLDCFGRVNSYLEKKHNGEGGELSEIFDGIKKDIKLYRTKRVGYHIVKKIMKYIPLSVLIKAISAQFF